MTKAPVPFDSQNQSTPPSLKELRQKVDVLKIPSPLSEHPSIPPSLEDRRRRAEEHLKRLTENSNSESPSAAPPRIAFSRGPAPQAVLPTSQPAPSKPPALITNPTGHRMPPPPTAPAKQHDTEGKSAFAELAPLAEILNAESDGLNSLIQTYNQRLRAFNLGVEAWSKESDGIAYGFCRVGDPSEWQLAARWASTDFGDGRKQYQSVPLLKRSRNERIQGLELVPEILDKLKEDAVQKIAAIRKARELAASL